MLVQQKRIHPKFTNNFMDIEQFIWVVYCGNCVTNIPRESMYGIFTYIDPLVCNLKNNPNVGKYSSTMDP